ncbi:hypothetical protein GCM10027445_45650 [Amycolatopsis endophytica]|uniref:Uncharacterized protein n=1 Tax=Amycolatopsis endophytica TaxID=860233 RepID=A0A853B0F7_9PSEU|nr:hypothetical protein [Amycolatopsis endophytica]NYI88543.1 hypothetical protein [Amycolatopsis endophytica]
MREVLEIASRTLPRKAARELRAAVHPTDKRYSARSMPGSGAHGVR